MPASHDTSSAATIDLAHKVAFLRETSAYPEPTTRVDVIETHMSWVFLTDRFVYKMKKPVRFSFLDYGTLSARHTACRESVRLNRRLAPEVYLGVLPLTVSVDGRFTLDGHGEVVEWLEKMVRLPAADMLDRMIADRRLAPEHVDRIAQRLVGFYRHLRPEREGAAYPQRLRDDLDADAEALADPAYDLGTARIERLHAALRDAHTACTETLRARAEVGHLIEGHGDLRPEHVAVLPRPLVIDCLEFNREFRILDPIDELGYLGLECERLGAAWVGPRVLDVYARAMDDSPPPRLVDFYQAHRALLRAKLAAWHTRDHDPASDAHWLGRAAQYLELAEARLLRA
jgi:aminoglycoside phosphotransferase family enzyme